MELNRVQLPVFEGPLDLLLHLIQKNELDITAISLAAITQQYLDYLELIQEFNIELASEFLVTAAELARLKSRSLLPQSEDDEADLDDEFLDEGELVTRLLQYQRFKQAAETLARRPQLNIDLFPRAVHRADWKGLDAGPVPIRPESPGKLIQLYHAMLARDGRELIHRVIGEQVSVRQKMVELLDFFREEGQATLRRLIARAVTRPQKIGLFLAVLELIRMKVVQLSVGETSGDWQLARSDHAEAGVAAYEEDFRS